MYGEHYIEGGLSVPRWRSSALDELSTDGKGGDSSKAEKYNEIMVP